MSDRPNVPPGERFADIDAWDHARITPPHIWHTLGYRRLAWEPGSTTIAWDATADYAFPTASGPRGRARPRPARAGARPRPPQPCRGAPGRCSGLGVLVCQAHIRSHKRA